MNFFRTIIIPIFLLVGIVGNSLSIVTVTNKHCKKSSYTVFLTALAIADLLTLILSIADRWIIETFNVPMETIGPVYCRLQLFFASLFSGLSLWTIVLLAVERTFSIYKPIKARSVCKPKTALKTMAVLTVILLGYSSHYIYGSKLGIRQDRETTDITVKTTNATALERNDTVRFPDYDLTTSASCINDKETNNESVTVGIKGSTMKTNGDNDGQLGLDISGWNDYNPENDTWLEITCNQSCTGIHNQTKGFDNEVNSSSPTGSDKSIGRLLTEDTIVDEFVNAGHGELLPTGNTTTTPNDKNSVDVRSVTADQTAHIGSSNTVYIQENSTAGDSGHIERTTTVNGISDNTTDESAPFELTTIENGNFINMKVEETEGLERLERTSTGNGNFNNIQGSATDDSGLVEQTTIENGLSVDIQDDTTGNAGLFERTAIENDNLNNIQDSATDDSGLVEQTTIGNELSVDKQDDTTGNAGPFERTTIENDNINDIQDSAVDDCMDSAAQLSNETFLPSIDNAGDYFNCVFASQDYVNFYRIWIWFDSLSLFVIPVVILIVANTATWIKVYRMSHGPLINPTSQTIRRTRHVIILTTLISISFILFVSPFMILLILESETDDDLQYASTNENRALLKLIAECLFLCNPTCNFFLYIISGKRFRNSLKAAFCKPKPESKVIAQKPLEMLPAKVAVLKTASGQNAQNG